MLEVHLFPLSQLRENIQGNVMIEIGGQNMTRTLNYTAEQIITQCAWCWKVKHGDVWTSFSGGNLANSIDNVSHGACPACFKKLTGRDYVEQ